MEYLIVMESSAAKLTVEVTRLIGEGWRPQGGVAISTHVPGGHDREWTYAQALTRPDWLRDA